MLMLVFDCAAGIIADPASSSAQEHGIPNPPRTQNTSRWMTWSQVVMDILEIWDGSLGVKNRPRNKDNGLPKGFTLVEESLHSERTRPKTTDDLRDGPSERCIR